MMAQLLGGDTLHHALGIPAFASEKHEEDDLKNPLGTAKRVLQWRWLIIDEISMVSAKLLAQTDCKTRQVVRDLL